MPVISTSSSPCPSTIFHFAASTPAATPVKKVVETMSNSKGGKSGDPETPLEYDSYSLSQHHA